MLIMGFHQNNEFSIMTMVCVVCLSVYLFSFDVRLEQELYIAEYYYGLVLAYDDIKTTIFL